jgi:hypothetical protein
MKKKTLLLLVLVGLVLIISNNANPVAKAAALPAQPSPAAPADIPETFVSDNNGVQLLTATSNGLFWTTDCGGEFLPALSHVKSKPTGGGEIRRLFQPSECLGTRVISNVAVDGTYAYWQNANGEVVRLPLGAPFGTAPTLVATKEAAATTGEVAVDSTYVYWTENTFLPAAGKVFRAPKAGGAGELMQAYDSPMSNLRADGAGAVFYISSPFFTDTLVKTYPSGASFTSYGVTALAQSYTFDSTWLYFADDLKRPDCPAPLSDLTTITLWYDVDDTGSPDLRAMTIDGSNLYWHEYRAPGGGPPVFSSSNPRLSGWTRNQKRSISRMSVLLRSLAYCRKFRAR